MSIVSNFDLLPNELIAEIIAHIELTQLRKQKIYLINNKFYRVYNAVLCDTGIPIMMSQDQMIRHITSQPDSIEGYFIFSGDCDEIWHYAHSIYYKSENQKYNATLTYFYGKTPHVYDYCSDLDEVLLNHTFNTKYYPNVDTSRTKCTVIPGYQTVKDILMQHHMSHKSQFLKNSLLRTLNYYLDAMSSDISIKDCVKFMFLSKFKEDFSLSACV
jgi:hypothetical protein